jgi:hypothetical protein
MADEIPPDDAKARESNLSARSSKVSARASLLNVGYRFAKSIRLQRKLARLSLLKTPFVPRSP